MAIPIFPSNDLVVGVGPLKDENGNLATGMTITAWLSEKEEHSAGNPAPKFHPELSEQCTESDPGVSGDYPGHIAGAKIDEHVIDIPNPPAELFLHRADDTSGWTHPVERCRIYPRRYL